MKMWSKIACFDQPHGSHAGCSAMSDKLKTTPEVGQLRADNMSKMKETYAALAIEADNVRYGWIRV